MKMTNEQMYESLAALISAKETGTLGYAISKNRRKIEGELVEYIRIRQELLERYGESDEESNTFHLKGENLKKYMEEMDTYNNMECEIDLMRVSLEVFTGGNLDSNQMYALEWMIEEKE